MQSPSCSPEEQAMHQQIRVAVKSLTRYESTALEILEATTETIPLTACRRFLTSFEIDEETATGRLPSHIPNYGDTSTLTRHLQAARKAAYASLPERLERWQFNNARTPEARITPQDALSDDALGGYEIGCQSCSRTGRLRCDVCKGQQRFRCDACKGTGKQTCDACDGHGNLKCKWCNGKGYLAEERARSYLTGTHGDQVENIETYHVAVPCDQCNGRGTRPCLLCDAGIVDCRECQGRGSLPCGNCNAAGAVSCAPCAGTGWRHEIGRLRCEARYIFFVEPRTDRQEVLAYLADMETLTQLCAVASIQPYQVVRQKALLDRVYTGEVRVTTLSLRAAGRAIDLVGYGDPPHIRDYKNLAGHLLQADLESLETTLADASRRSHALLEGVLSRFLASPAHVHLGKQAFASFSAVSDTFLMNVVSEDYVARAGTALRAGIERVYQSTTPLLLAGLLLLPLPLLLLADATGFWPLGPYSPVIAALGAGLIASILEFCTLRRLRRLLGPDLGKCVQHALRQTGVLQRRRRRLAAMAVCGALVGWIGTAMIKAFLLARHS